ncbi:ATP-binding cassette domain-containing protein [Weissella muntiaci]|uniref:ATP-binding cassette domain-containing protein n=1 Tax=Weissella muntiaci TaxID=2508881 RepID=A0A6C2C2K4_9LACO|nr:ATP-binding cassette domain-containing protein [Weissella muntiaci]TYC48154.1 ATP-binding cassette domain-containing protein [Weissella muntiaci]
MIKNNPVLELKGLQKIFFPGTVNQRHILKNIDLKVYPGEFISIIGNNGAGKSTLINAIAGALKVDKGEIEILGQTITKTNIRKRANWIARVFQDPKLGTADQLSVYENMVLADDKQLSDYFKGYDNTKKRTQFASRLAALDMGIEAHIDTPVKYLSGGQRQALSLLMAIIRKPQLLLLDEHTAALDPKTSQTVMELTAQLIEQERLTALMITHDIDDALAYGNRLIMVQDGQIKLDVQGAEKAHLLKADLIKMFAI